MKKSTFEQKQAQFDNQAERAVRAARLAKQQRRANAANPGNAARSDWAGMTNERCAY